MIYTVPLIDVFVSSKFEHFHLLTLANNDFNKFCELKFFPQDFHFLSIFLKVLHSYSVFSKPR